MRHSIRRAAVVALLASVTLVPGPADLAVQAAGAPEPGQGVAAAQTVKFDPKAGGLSLGITFGQAVAAHQNQVAQATSQAINLGVIGSTLASEGCDGSAPSYPADQQPQPLRVDSRDQNADKGKTATEYGVFGKSVRANSTPFAEAITTTAPFSIPGLFDLGGGVARTRSGLVNGVREAVATVDLASIVFPGGVELSGLHWEAVYRSSGTRSVVGKFSVTHASIGGNQLPDADPSAVFAQANTALAPLGLKIVPPVAHEAGGVMFVDPVAIAVVPSAQRDGVAGAVLGAAQPARQALFDALLQQSCKNSTYITIFDLVVGSVTGAGEFAVELGGAQASSGEIAQNQFHLLTGDYELAGGDVPAATGTVDETRGATDAGPVDLGTAPTPPTPATPANQSAAPTIAKHAAGGRGGKLALVGIVTLALVALIAEADRRKMRGAQRAIAAMDD